MMNLKEFEISVDGKNVTTEHAANIKQYDFNPIKLGYKESIVSNDAGKHHYVRLNCQSLRCMEE